MGALNEAYAFLYSWLFSSEPVAVFAPYAQEIAMFLTLFFVVAMMVFAFILVTGLIKLVFYMFRL